MQVTNKAFKPTMYAAFTPQKLTRKWLTVWDEFFRQCSLRKLLLSDMISA